MDFAELKKTWNELARKDAMWAVLTGPAGERRKWDSAAFFQSGVDEINAILERVRATGTPVGNQRALDFGCGVGRLTQALCGHFRHVDGVDIAGAMIEKARMLNRFAERCAYHLNETDDLRLFADASFDFVYSNITLQHMEARYSRRYIEEFFRISKPGSVIVFQIPARPLTAEHPRTSSPDPLPREACRASIEPPASELRCGAGAKLLLAVLVRNMSAQTWPASGREDESFSIRLGNHWYGRFGWKRGPFSWRLHAFDDARAALPHDVPPGDVVEVGLLVNAPVDPGSYRLDLDMVQESVRWFAQAGSKPAHVTVNVDGRLRGDEVLGLPGRMEMHGIPRPEVESLIAQCGGTLLAADPDDAPGKDWESWRYFVVVN